MSKYYVAFDDSVRNAYIMNDGTPVPEGFENIGSFTDEDKPKENNGDHLFIAMARQFLSELGISDFSTVTIEDKASNEPEGAGEIIPTTKEVEQRNAAGLAERDPEGTEATHAGEPAKEALEKAEDNPKPVKKLPPKNSKKK